MKRLFHSAVLFTRRIPGLRFLYKTVYLIAARFSAWMFTRIDGMRAIYLHRGLSQGGCEPGVSDIDLVLIGESGWGGDEAAFLERLASSQRNLKSVFPMLGDLWIGTSEETGNYLRWGGLRAWEDVPYWKRLAGAAIVRPALAESSLKRRWLDPWVWAFVNHMELSRRFFSAAGPAAKREAELKKLYFDARRYCSLILEGDLLTREQSRKLYPEAERTGVRELWIDSSIRLARASRRVLEAVASPSNVPAHFPPSSADPCAARLLSAVPRTHAVVIDPPYHTYVLLAEGAPPEDYGKIAVALNETVDVIGVPVALEPAAWALLLQSSYLGAPLGWPGSEGGNSSGTLVFSDWNARAAGGSSFELPILAQGLGWESAAEAASWMALWWRSLWIAEGWPNRFVLFHLYTRALGLKLTLSGEASGPYSDWELLLARSAARFPHHQRQYSKIRSLLLSESAAALDSTNRQKLDPAHRRTISQLMAGLQEALARGPAEIISKA